MDTAVAHVAGAIGVPVWIILPARAELIHTIDNDQGESWLSCSRCWRRPFVRAASRKRNLKKLCDRPRRAGRNISTLSRDLTAVETWVTEILNTNGTIDKHRTVVSDFFVYRSRFKNDVVREYRITREVDGKAAGNPADQAMKLFRALAAATTLEQEQAALREQNFRHILRFIVWGLTVDPFWAVQSDRRQSFNFAPSERQRLGDRDTIVLAYEAKAFRSMQPTLLFRRFNRPRSGSRGTAWLDAKDWRLRRWVTTGRVVTNGITIGPFLEAREIGFREEPPGWVSGTNPFFALRQGRGKKHPLCVRPPYTPRFPPRHSNVSRSRPLPR